MISNGVGGTEPIRTQGGDRTKYAGFSDLHLSPRHAWRLQALCLEVDPAIFFPDKSKPTNEAKAVCELCDVQAECLTWALETNQRHGIFGGMGPAERQRLQGKAQS